MPAGLIRWARRQGTPVLRVIHSHLYTSVAAPSGGGRFFLRWGRPCTCNDCENMPRRTGHQQRTHKLLKTLDCTHNVLGPCFSGLYDGLNLASYDHALLFLLFCFFQASSHPSSDACMTRSGCMRTQRRNVPV